MNRLTFWLGLPLLLLGSTVTVLAWLQNSARTTDLSLNLGFVAWELAEPVAVPALVATALGAGFLLGAVVFGSAWARARGRARRAERAVAVSGSGWSPAGPAGSGGGPAAHPDDGWK